MKYWVFVKFGRTKKVEIIDDKSIIVCVVSKPIEGKANQEVIETISKWAGTAKSNIKILSGHKSRKKLIEVINQPSGC